MLTVQKILALRRVELFASLSARELGRLATLAEEVVFPAGATIFREGDSGDALYVIVDGEVRIHKGDATINRLKANDYFGDMTLLDGSPRSASATASSDCLLLCLKQSDLHAILSSNFEAVLAIVRSLCDRIRRAEGRERELRAAAASRPAAEGNRK